MKLEMSVLFQSLAKQPVNITPSFKSTPHNLWISCNAEFILRTSLPNRKYQQHNLCTYNVPTRRVQETTIAVEKQ